MLSALLDAIEANVRGTMRDVDTEFLHDLRIAVRRTRSALKLAGTCCRGGLAARFRPEFKWLGDLTTPPGIWTSTCSAIADMADGLVAADAAELHAVPAST